jgi:hypothetical protein
VPGVPLVCAVKGIAADMHVYPKPHLASEQQYTCACLCILAHLSMYPLSPPVSAPLHPIWCILAIPLGPGSGSLVDTEALIAICARKLIKYMIYPNTWTRIVE